jgi:hypothetical protein
MLEEHIKKNKKKYIYIGVIIEAEIECRDARRAH